MTQGSGCQLLTSGNSKPVSSAFLKSHHISNDKFWLHEGPAFGLGGKFIFLRKICVVNKKIFLRLPFLVDRLVMGELFGFVFIYLFFDRGAFSPPFDIQIMFGMEFLFYLPFFSLLMTFKCKKTLGNLTPLSLFQL